MKILATLLMLCGSLGAAELTNVLTNVKSTKNTAQIPASIKMSILLKAPVVRLNLGDADAAAAEAEAINVQAMRTYQRRYQEYFQNPRALSAPSLYPSNAPGSFERSG